MAAWQGSSITSWAWRNHSLCGIVCLTLPPACSNEIHISRNLDEEVSIFPDYKEVTIPVNIAPLDFSVLNAGGSETVLRIEGGPTRIVVKGDDRDRKSVV